LTSDLQGVHEVSKNQGDDQRLTKAERKEQARLEREEIQRKQSGRKRTRAVSLIVGLVLAAGVIGLLVMLGGDDNEAATGGTPIPSGVTLPDPATLPGVMQTPAPWSNNLAQANERLALLGLPGLSDTILHYHVRLWIYVDGEPVVVPTEVGYSQALQVASPLHTHDDTGTVHVEADDPTFQPVLGQFMDVWGLYFTPTCLGDACNDGDRQLRAFTEAVGGGNEQVRQALLLECRAQFGRRTAPAPPCRGSSAPAPRWTSPLRRPRDAP
jgi:hypothetical protein